MLIGRLRRRLSNELADLLSRTLGSRYGLNLDFLFACSRGLFRHRNGKVSQLLSGNYFGLTRTANADEFIVARYVTDGVNDERSRLFRIRLAQSGCEMLGEMSFFDASGPRIPVRVHQIRWHDDSLFLTNTRQNEVWRCAPDGRIQRSWHHPVAFPYAGGATSDLRDQARSSPDYRHFNSLSFREGSLMVLAHNGAGEVRDRPSKLYQLSENLELIGRAGEFGRACHDLKYADDGALLVCSSGTGELLRNGKPVLQLDYFLRGLCQIDSIIVIGGTPFRANALRSGLDTAKLFFVDANSFRCLSTLNPGRVGDVHDLLAL